MWEPLPRTRAQAPDMTREFIDDDRIYVDNEYLKKNGEIVHLAGAAFGPIWNLNLTMPGSSQAKEIMVRDISEAGSNFVYIVVNLALWSDPSVDNEQY